MLDLTATRHTSPTFVPGLPATGTRGQTLDDAPASVFEPSLRVPVFASRRAQVLVIGDGLRSLARQMDAGLPGRVRQVHVAATGRVGIEHVRGGSADIVVLDLRLSDQSGLDVLQQIRAVNRSIPVIFISIHADAVIAAMKHGAHDCLPQSVQPAVLRRVVDEALDVAQRTHPAEAPTAVPDEEAESQIVGCCPAMSEVYKAIGRVAAQDVPVLITGESGTGKELVARAVHQHGPRAEQPFLALNCAAIPENLLESELFGHEKGAFTGADRRRIGKFEQCSGGTIFLDEIGDMPLSLQAKMLRLLQDQTFERVGGNETVRTNVRLIAATHRDLKACSAQGKFRHDLYYRLGVFTIQLPPLRERGDDLDLLVQHYVRRFSCELGRQVRAVAADALERLRAYAWPGNIRELQSVLKQALLKASGTVLLPAFLPPLPGSGDAAVPPDAQESGAATCVIDPRLAADVPRSVCTDTSGTRSRFVATRPEVYARQSATGRPPSGNRPADPAPENPRSWPVGRSARRGGG